MCFRAAGHLRLGPVLAAGLLAAGHVVPALAARPSAEVGMAFASGRIAPGQSQAYQIAMGRYEALIGVDLKAMPPMPLIPPVQRYLWAWVNDTGRVQRLAQGVFRLSGKDCLSRFCTQVSCKDAGWPEFNCSDHRQRHMSAPNAKTMVFGGIEYKRMGPVP